MPPDIALRRAAAPQSAAACFDNAVAFGGLLSTCAYVHSAAGKSKNFS